MKIEKLTQNHKSPSITKALLSLKKGGVLRVTTAREGRTAQGLSTYIRKLTGKK